MSSPQQPWQQGQPVPTQPSAPSAYGAPQGYGAPGQPVPQGPPNQGQQAYGGGPTGELVINLMKPFGAMGMISPVVTIDGYPASCSWGRNAFPAPAGVRQVAVAQTYLWTYGRATLGVSVEPGRASEIFYAGPMATFGLGGAIGTVPQKRPGGAVFIGIMVFLAVLVLLGILSAVIGNS